MDPLTGTNLDGAMPVAGLVLSNGTLYGTTSVGGSGANGTVFAVGTNGTGFTVLHHFSAVDAVTQTNTEGANPQAALILSGDTLYGTAPAGGAGADGTVFSVNTDGSQFKTLYSFTAADASTGTNADGAVPIADLLESGNTLYGTTFGGGAGAAGTVFILSLIPPPAAITNIVHNLDGSVTLSFLGSSGSSNIVQAATNLTPPAVWWNVSTNKADGDGAWQFTDTNTAQFPAQFYRSYSF
jgi:uncharacterized repeat protein (TIGR03803 family)